MFTEPLAIRMLLEILTAESEFWNQTGKPSEYCSSKIWCTWSGKRLFVLNAVTKAAWKQAYSLVTICLMLEKSSGGTRSWGDPDGLIWPTTFSKKVRVTGLNLSNTARQGTEQEGSIAGALWLQPYYKTKQIKLQEVITKFSGGFLADWLLRLKRHG